MKTCYKCGREYPLTKFSRFKSGKNNGYYHSYCRLCCQGEMRKYFKTHPWAKTFKCLVNRCRYNEYYLKKDIKNYLTLKDLRYLWFRDKAYLLNKPSIDRINNKGNYILKNCRYIELIENIRRSINSMCKPVNQYDLNNSYIKTFPSISEAARTCGVSRLVIRDCASGKQKTSAGYKWKVRNK